MLFFCKFSDIKNVGQSQQQKLCGQLVTSESQHTGIGCPKES